MGIRLEPVLIIAIIVTVGMNTMMKLSNSSASNNMFNKEMEFTDTTFIEVDREKMQSKSFAKKGVRENMALMVENLRYSTDSIELLVSNKGTYHEDILYLDGNVKLKEKEGYIYSAEHAKYNQKTEILTVTSPFIAYMDKNIIRGTSLHYNALTKELNATKVDAVIYTTEK